MADQKKENLIFQNRTAVSKDDNPKYDALLDKLPQGFCIIEVMISDDKPVDYRFLQVNAIFEQQTGLRHAAGKTMRELAPTHEDHWFNLYAEVAKTRKPLHFEQQAAHSEGGAWYEVFALPFGNPEDSQVALFFNDITKRKKAEERQAFLLKLNDALIPLRDAKNIKNTACTLLGQHLKVSRVNYFDISNGNFRADAGYADGAVPLTNGTVVTFGELWLQAFRNDEMMVSADVATDPRFSAGEKKNLIAFDITSFIAAMLVKDGEWLAAFSVHYKKPRNWSQDEITLVKEVALRIHEAAQRGRAEEALLQSEEKYRTLFNSIDEGFASIEMIYDETGSDVDWRFLEVNPVFERLSGLANVTGRLNSEVNTSTETYWRDGYEKVLQTGNPWRVEHYHETTGRWYQVYASRIGNAGSRKIAVIFDEITERKRSEDTQSFLLKLSDALRPLSDPVAIQETAMQVLGRHLGLNRAFYCEVLEDDDTVVIGPGYAHGLPPILGRVKFSEFDSDQLAIYRTGQPLVINDLYRDGKLSAKAAFDAVQLRAVAGIGLVTNGKVRAIITIHQSTPRKWSATEIGLLQHTAERTWAAVEKGKAEEAMRKSEEKYRNLFEKMEQGYGEAELIRNAEGKAIDYRMIELNPAFEKLMGIPIANAKGKRALEVFPGMEHWWIEKFDEIVQSGSPAIIEHESPLSPVRQWYQVNVYPRDADRFMVLYEDISLRKKAETSLRDSEERKAFLLNFNDTLKPIADPVEIQAEAARLFGEYLKVERAGYAEVVGDKIIIHRDYTHGVPSMAGTYTRDVFGQHLSEVYLNAGIYAENDVQANPEISAEAKNNFRLVNIGAYMGASLYKKDKITAGFSAHSIKPRNWTGMELSLAGEVTERTRAAIERARSEEALQKSEAKYRTLFETMAQGYQENEIIRNQEGMAIDYRMLSANPQFERLTGISLEKALNHTVHELFPDIEPFWLEFFDSIVKTGKSERLEREFIPLKKWYQLYAYPRRGDRFAVLFEDITDRKKSEIALQENDKQKAFLLKLSDAIRPLKNAVEVQETAMQVLGEYLQVNRAFYSEMQEDGDTLIFGTGYTYEVIPLKGETKFSSFDTDMVSVYNRGETVIIEDVYTDFQFTKRAKANFDAIKVRAAVGVPLVKGGKVRAILSLHQSTPRQWTAAEIALLEETAERTWAAVERAKAESAMGESEKKYRSLFETMNEGFHISELIYDASGKPVDYQFLEVNQAFGRLTGLTNVVGKRGSEIAPNTEFYWMEDYDKVIKTGESMHIEHYNQDTQRWYLAHVSRLGSAGSCQMAVVFDNITKRKQTEIAILESEERKAFLLKLSDALRPLSASAQIKSVAVKLLAEHLDANRAYYGEVIGDNFIIEHDYYAGSLRPMDRETPMKIWGKAHLDQLASGITAVIDDVHTHPLFTGETTAAYDAAGFCGGIGVPLIKNGVWKAVLEVTAPEPRTWKNIEIKLSEEVAERTWVAVERAKTEEALKLSEERFRIALNSANMAAWDWNIAEDSVIWNEQHYYMLGLQPGSKYQKSNDFLHFIHPEDVDMIHQKLRDAIEKTGVYSAEFRIVRMDKQVCWMSGYGRAVQHDSNGKATRMVGVMYDITENKLREKLKDEFIGIASHELKTPVTSMKAYAEIALESLKEKGDTENSDLISRLSVQVDRLNVLTSHLLDTTRISEGQLQLNFEAFDMNELLQEKVEEIRHTSHHQLHAELQKLPPMNADRERIGQVITNLLSNAIKYSPKQSSIIIRSELKEQYIEVSVQDHGLGIPENDQPKVFDRFFRVTANNMHTFPGMGLGLYITAQIIRRHGGTINVKSKENEGSVFYFRVPINTGQ